MCCCAVLCCDPKASTIPFSNSADVFDIFLISGVADFFSFSYILKKGSSLPVNTAMHLCLCWATMLGKQLVMSSANEAILNRRRRRPTKQKNMLFSKPEETFSCSVVWSFCTVVYVLMNTKKTTKKQTITY